jgi:hypothetical protein
VDATDEYEPILDDLNDVFKVENITSIVDPSQYMFERAKCGYALNVLIFNHRPHKMYKFFANTYFLTTQS